MAIFFGLHIITIERFGPEDSEIDEVRKRFLVTDLQEMGTPESPTKRLIQNHQTRNSHPLNIFSPRSKLTFFLYQTVGSYINRWYYYDMILLPPSVFNLTPSPLENKLTDSATATCPPPACRPVSSYACHKKLSPQNQCYRTRQHTINYYFGPD